MRLDKFLCELNCGTRSQVKLFLKQGRITVNGIVVKNADMKINELKDCICFDQKTLHYQKFYYYMLNKPAGVVSATEDKSEKTVIDLLREEDRRNDLFPAGRLDKDTEGFLLLTNDGELSHRLLSPKKHVNKCYYIEAKLPIDTGRISELENGLDIGEDHLTMPAKAELIDETHLYLTIHEGKFHQVKRMLEAINNQVIYLKRVSFGPLKLDEKLKLGEYRELTDQEVALLYEA